jgi:hypothetical protein
MNVHVSPDNRLAAVDHGLFTQHHAVGRNLAIQVVWVYEHPIDLEGVKRFHHNLGCGLLGRRIERSPLPFARHHWIIDRRPSELDLDDCARPRADLSEWADERSQMPIDPERGPGWHLGILPLTDGTTAVSLVLSHYLVDGLGLVLTLIDAAVGNNRHLGYPPPRARPRLRAVVQDARQTVRDVPEVARALRAAAKQARRQRQDMAGQPAPPPAALLGAGLADDQIVVPGITVCVDLADWDARADALGGTSSTLGAGFAARLGDLIGRRRTHDGAVTLELPMNERTENDSRANAMSFVRVGLDPSRVATDLSDARAVIKAALTAREQSRDDAMQIAWLAAFTPKRAFRRMDDAMVADPDCPVFYSNLGDVGGLVNHIDGTPAEYVSPRVIAQHESRRWLDRTGGQMILQLVRVPGRCVISVNAYQPGAENSKPALREMAARALAEFALAGSID